MKIKKTRGRELSRFLVRVGAIGLMMVAANTYLSIERVNNNDFTPDYKDGDLVISNRFSNEPILLIRVRGFDDGDAE